MPRRVRPSNSAGLREQLLGREQRRLKRWRIPGRVYEAEEALKSGAPIVVSAAILASVLPGQSFGSGSDDELFLLDERNQLRRWRDP
jgi:hypothetical protein